MHLVHGLVEHVLEGPRVIRQKVSSRVLDVYVVYEHVRIDLLTSNWVEISVAFKVLHDLALLISEATFNQHWVLHQLVCYAA